MEVIDQAECKKQLMLTNLFILYIARAVNAVNDLGTG